MANKSHKQHGGDWFDKSQDFRRNSELAEANRLKRREFEEQKRIREQREKIYKAHLVAEELLKQSAASQFLRFPKLQETLRLLSSIEIDDIDYKNMLHETITICENGIKRSVKKLGNNDAELLTKLSKLIPLSKDEFSDDCYQNIENCATNIPYCTEKFPDITDLLPTTKKLAEEFGKASIKYGKIDKRTQALFNKLCTIAGTKNYDLNEHYKKKFLFKLTGLAVLSLIIPLIGVPFLVILLINYNRATAQKVITQTSNT